MRKPGRHWFKDRCGGIEWEHRLIDPKTLKQKNDGQECYAVSLESERTVYYSDAEADDALKLLYLHETHHRPSMVPGECHALYKIYGTEDPDTYTDREESAAVYYGRVYNEAAGPFIRLPKPPRRKS